MNLWEFIKKYYIDSIVYKLSSFIFDPEDKLNVKNIKKTINPLNFDSVYINGIYSWYFL